MFAATTFSITTFSIMTFETLSMMDLCIIVFGSISFMLSATNKNFMLSVIILNVVMPSVVMLNVVAPFVSP